MSEAWRLEAAAETARRSAAAMNDAVTRGSQVASSLEFVVQRAQEIAHQLDAAAIRISESTTEIDGKAALIAAAPDLLEILKSILGAISPDCQITRDRVLKVIAKAEGRS